MLSCSEREVITTKVWSRSASTALRFWKDLRQIEYDRYSTLDDMKLAVEHDLRQHQSRAECPCRCPCLKIFQISMLDNAKTLSLIFTPSCDDGPNIQILFK